MLLGYSVRVTPPAPQRKKCKRAADRSLALLVSHETFCLPIDKPSADFLICAVLLKEKVFTDKLLFTPIKK